MEETILEGIGYAIPALVTGAVAYFVMSGLRNQETNEKKLDLLAQKKESHYQSVCKLMNVCWCFVNELTLLKCWFV